MSITRLLLAGIVLAFTATTLPAETLKIGFNYPQNGRYKDQGLQERLGAFMAVDEINRDGGILGQPIELVIRNNSSDPKQGAANTAELIDRENARMVFGGVSSAVAIASGEEARKRDRLYFGTLTYSNATTGSAGHRHMFREPFNAWMAAKAISHHLQSRYAGQKFFYITADYTWGWSTESSMRRFTNTMDTDAHPGVKTPFPRAYIRDFKAALEQAQASDADVLVMVLFGDDMVRALNIAYEMGIKDRMQVVVPNITLGMAQDVGPTIMEGVIGSVPWVWEVPYKYNYPRGKQFVEDFVKRYNMRPSSAAASAYSILYQYRDAVERAGTLDTAAVTRALEDYRYSLLKDEQQWRAFDHQNVQTVYVVKSKPRDEILKDPLGSDFFEIVDSLDGNSAAKTLEEWQEERRAAKKPLTL
ncbi:ABC transporter substrate-binding protein [Marinobacter halodurans]|uniref:ABC transporter substrate-binding protein n=1 Tax=Marinobacter halodurans TaxID=2528979 RepID=A0ABY1ZIC7_9GAMM|nr:ABC transporter substrate-binding protein [Marinobacter halodurans]TBW54375.1 ABC transporter substrate-binding protein [Marinobacter halodurans]